MEMKESENAKAVARDVSESIRKGKKVNLGQIAQKHGYSKTTSERPSLITETKSYQNEIKPFVEQLRKEQQRLFNSIQLKDLDEMQYESAVRSLDILTKNIQLLSGGATEKIINIEISQEIKDKYL
jgi:hypothetical protein